VERAQADLRALEEQLSTLRLQKRESLPTDVRRRRLGQAVKDARRKLANTKSQLEELFVEAQRLEERRTALLEREALQATKLAKLEEDLQALEPDAPMEEQAGDHGDTDVFAAVTTLRAELAAKDQELEKLRAALAAQAASVPGAKVPAEPGLAQAGAGAKGSGGRRRLLLVGWPVQWRSCNSKTSAPWMALRDPR
jgi:chromosome segregation ATPase